MFGGFDDAGRPRMNGVFREGVVADADGLSGTLLSGKVALWLVQALRHWARTRDCAHLLCHVTNGENAAEADRFFRRCGMKTVGGNYH
ncbi:hypothetical protein [Roseibium sp.]|uniref:hypothetical protein n=1 Tax=Roseibium sp. TaxID=1936156 RepID=UPI003A9735F0